VKTYYAVDLKQISTFLSSDIIFTIKLYTNDLYFFFIKIICLICFFK